MSDICWCGSGGGVRGVREGGGSSVDGGGVVNITPGKEMSVVKQC